MSANANISASALGLLLGALLAGAEQPAPGPEKDAGRQAVPPAQKALVERSRKLVADMRRLGPWSEEAKLIQQTNSNLFREYALDSEEDRYAEKLVNRVAEIPPWDFMGRFELAFSMAVDRYEFDADQAAQIKAKVLWRTFQFAGKHVPTIMGLSEEFLAARLEHRPFTASEVARWSQTVEPLLLEANTQYEELCREVEPLLRDEQRELWARDRAADDRRTRLLMAKLGDWQQGRWRPEDWGLHDDPLHKEYFERRKARSATAPGEVDPEGREDPSYDPADPDAWTRYVNDFIKRYRLDEAQTTAARALLRDVRTQAEVHRAAVLREAARPESSDRMVRIRTRLFEQLKRRLDQVPTDKQSRAVRATTQPSSGPGVPPPSSPVPGTATENPAE